MTLRGFLPLLLLVTAETSRAGMPDAAQARRLFRDPPREYATAPLWVWNDRLTEAQIRGTLRDLAGQSVRQVFVHPRPGLMTPYLSAEWFELWKSALDEAAKLDLNVWIYDENSYPSGFAGGWVPELMPESRGRGLHFREGTEAPTWTADTLAVYRLEGAEAEDVSARVRAGERLGGGRYLAAVVQRAGNSPWHGDRCYVDLLYPGVTEKFLDVTLGAYEREIGRQFGKRVPGVFTDEPNIIPAGGLPWTEDFAAQFERRRGYSLLPALVSLRHETGDWRRVRHDFFRTALELFIERWGRPFYERCDRLGLEFTGHYWEHEWPHCIGVPDNMAMAAWQHRPGIDTLMNQYAEDTHAQFGNIRAPKEVLSLANQLGRNRTLVELYGAGGWDLRFEDMKRIADWLLVLGINTLDEHLSYITIRGARKRDHPQSFSYHEPWWQHYGVLARYTTRLSAAMSQGRQVNRVLLLEPTSTAWMYQGKEDRLQAIGNSFAALVKELEMAQIEYDLGCEDVLARHASVKTRSAQGDAPGARLQVGHAAYEVVVLPPGTGNLEGSTVRLLDSFLKEGGAVVACGPPPARIDGRASDQGTALAKGAGWRTVSTADLPETLRPWTDPERFRIERPAGDPGILFHHRRQLADGDLLLLVNTSIQHASTGSVAAVAGGVERWDPYTGKVEPWTFTASYRGIRAPFQLPPCGSLLLFLPNSTQKAPKPAQLDLEMTLTLPGPVTVERLEPNVLTLDYVDLTATGSTRSNLYFYAANQAAWQASGLPRNPWDSAVQFKDELITRTFPAESGFTVSYRFRVEGTVPSDLEIVIERPDLYTIRCNGQLVTATPGAWWLDHAFGRIPLASTARTGENVVTLTATPFTMYHEIEPAYVRGSFSLRPDNHGFVVTADRALTLGKANEPGHDIQPDGAMWLSGGIGYTSNAAAQPVEDRAPFLVFDFGKPTDLAAVRLWNYNEGHVRDLTSRGVKRLSISASVERQDRPETDLGAFGLTRGGTSAQSLKLNAKGVRYVRFDIRENHAGVTFPAAGTPADNGFAGLSEVQFIDAGGRAVDGVKVVAQSSELTSHRRLAAHLVDGSGLGPRFAGWDSQGHPFYGGSVAYRQHYRIDRKRGRYFVALPLWYGSVASVRVNGRPAGHIVSAPWECEVTQALRRGNNEIEVVVVGTLKNTLGPHHGGRSRGSAWPGMFQQGPAQGPPPGAQYDSIAYGLFEPLTVRQLVRK